MASTSVVYDILANDRASSKFAAVGRAADQSASRMSKIGGVLKRSAAVGFGALVYGAGAFAKSAIDTERQFSTSMRLIQASTGASSNEIEKLNDLAIKLGAETSFSANEAASAMLELAKAGLTTKTIMGGGLSGTLTLAAAGGVELATAATIASNAINTFNLRGRDMDSVAAALAGGANASSASVESLGQALQQVGPGATNAGLSLQETVAALSAFDAAGIKGSDAGTSLKTMLTRLVPSTEKAATAMRELDLDFTNSDGSFKSLTEIADELRGGLSKLSAEQRTQKLATIFGSDATRAATVLMNEGSDGIRKFIAATKDQNAAQEMAQARMSGTEGAMERLSGAIETAKLRLGQELAPAVVAGADALGEHLVPALETAIDAGKEIGSALAPAVSEIAEALGNLSGEGDGVSEMFDGFVSVLRVTSQVVGGVVDVIDGLPGPVKEIGIQAGIAALVFPRFAAGVTMATTAVSANIVKLQQLRAEMSYTETRAGAVSGMVSKLGGVLRGVAGVGGMVALTKGAQESNDALAALGKTMGGVLLGFALGGPTGAAIGGVAGLASSFRQLENAFADALGVGESFGDDMDSIADQENAAAAAAERHKEAIEALTATFNQAKTTAATLKPAYDNVLAQLEGSGVTAATASRQWRLLGVSQRTVAQASLGNADALRRINRAFNDAPLKDRIINEHTLADAIDNTTVTNRVAVRAERERLRLTQEWGGKLKSFPKEARTAIHLDGVMPSLRGIAAVAKQYKLTPKQIKTLIQVTGVDTSVRDVQNVKKNLDEVARTNPNPKINVYGEAARNTINGVSALLRGLNGNTAHTYVYTHFRKTGSGQGQSHSPNTGGYADGTTSAPPGWAWVGEEGPELMRFRGGEQVLTHSQSMAKASSVSARGGGGNIFKGLGEGVVRAFTRGIDGNANQAERAVDRMMKAIKKALSDDKITKAAAARMRETVKEMAREANKLREFTSTLRQSFKSEFDFGDLFNEEGVFAGAAVMQGNYSSLATRLKSFAVHLKELRRAGIPGGLIAEIASLGSDQGSQVAASILSAGTDRSGLAQAYKEFQRAAGSAAKDSAAAAYGPMRQIKQENHITINLKGGGDAKENGREIEQALIRWSRSQNRLLQIPVAR